MQTQQIWFYLWPLAAPTILGTILALVGRTWIIAKIQKRIENQYAEKIETVKAEIAAQAAEIAMTHKSLHDHAVAFHGRRLDALERTWHNFLHMHRSMPPFLIGRLDIMTPTEWSAFMEKFKREVDALDQDKEMMALEVEKDRPFVGEIVWNYFFAFRIVLLRTNYLVRDGIRAGKLNPWWEDDAIRLNLQILLTERELLGFSKREIGKLAFICETARRAFSRHIEEASAGSKLTETVIKEKERIARLRQLADTAEQKTRV